jgi:hypothetical protein
MSRAVSRLRSWRYGLPTQQAQRISSSRLSSKAGELPPLLGWDAVPGLYATGRDSGEELARVLGKRQAATIGPVGSAGDVLF